MTKPKQVFIDVHDKVIFMGKEGLVLDLVGVKALIYIPDLDSKKPYVVCQIEDLTKVDMTNLVN